MLFANVRGMPNYRRAFVPGGCWFFKDVLVALIASNNQTIPGPELFF
jgi:hypothetical protein